MKLSLLTSLKLNYTLYYLIFSGRNGGGQNKLPSSESGLIREESPTERGAKNIIYGNHDLCDRNLFPDNFLTFPTSIVNSYHGYIKERR